MSSSSKKSTSSNPSRVDTETSSSSIFELVSEVRRRALSAYRKKIPSMPVKEAENKKATTDVPVTFNNSADTCEIVQTGSLDRSVNFSVNSRPSTASSSSALAQQFKEDNSMSPMKRMENVSLRSAGKNNKYY